MTVKPDYEIWVKIKKEFEGFRTKSYKDSGGVWTIGFGTTYLYDRKRKVKVGDIISINDAVRYMEHDAAEVVRQANVYIKKDLNAAQSTAICDYIYNRGIGNFLKAKFNGWDLDDIINFNPNDPRIPQIIQGTGLRDKLGNWLRGLQRRRNCEALLYRTGALVMK